MDLAVKIAGIEFKNPIIAASGYPTYHPKLMKKCVEAGVAGVTMKTTSVVEQNWMKQTLAPLFYDKWGGETGTISCQYGFIQPDTAAKYLKEMKPITKKEDVVLIASIEATASDLEGWGNLAKKCEDAGADMIGIAVDEDNRKALSRFFLLSKKCAEFQNTYGKLFISN